MRIQAYVMSCPERTDVLRRTLRGLVAAGWPEEPALVVDRSSSLDPLQRIHENWRRMIKRASESEADYVLLLEDDLIFGRWFAHNLHAWPLLKQLPRDAALYASLYNPGRPFIVRSPSECYLVADARWVWGSQALLVTPGTARFLDSNWNACEGNPDIRMPRLARAVTPIYYHVPSLVDHAPIPTTWGGIEHRSVDFDPDWRAPDPT